MQLVLIPYEKHSAYFTGFCKKSRNDSYPFPMEAL